MAYKSKLQVLTNDWPSIVIKVGVFIKIDMLLRTPHQ